MKTKITQNGTPYNTDDLLVILEAFSARVIAWASAGDFTFPKIAHIEVLPLDEEYRKMLDARKTATWHPTRNLADAVYKKKNKSEPIKTYGLQIYLSPPQELWHGAEQLNGLLLGQASDQMKIDILWAMARHHREWDHAIRRSFPEIDSTGFLQPRREQIRAALISRAQDLLHLPVRFSL